MTSEPASGPAKDAEIWIICGNACAGKTTTARLLAQRLPLAAHIDGDEMQRLIASGCRWPVPGDSDPGTGRLTGEAGVQYALRIRNACLVAAAFAARVQAAADGRPVNEFEAIIERGLDRLPHVGLRVDPSGLDPHSVVDLLLDRRAEARWIAGTRPEQG